MIGTVASSPQCIKSSANASWHRSNTLCTPHTHTSTHKNADEDKVCHILQQHSCNRRSVPRICCTAFEQASRRAYAWGSVDVARTLISDGVRVFCSSEMKAGLYSGVYTAGTDVRPGDCGIGLIVLHWYYVRNRRRA